MYTPHEWILVEIKGTDPHYRLFASWRGGYGTGDSWQLNSGIVRIEEDEKFYYFHGHSGSIYKCYKHGYGISSMHNASVIQALASKTPDNFIILYDEPENIMKMDWIIKKNEQTNS